MPGSHWSLRCGRGTGTPGRPGHADRRADRPPIAVSEPTVSHPYLFTTIEIALVLVGGTIWYFRNGVDERWSRGAEWRAWKRKMTAEDIVFDGDHYNTNAVGHPLGGTAYYQIARGNGLGPGASFIASFLGSTFWEYFVEIPEHPSLNDLILTPAGGAVIGETTYQLGRYLARSGTSLGHCAGAFVFSPVASINDRPICRVRPGALLPWAKLGLSIGVNRAVFDGNVVREELAVAMGSEIVTQRAYQRPGSGSVPVAPGQWSLLFADGRFAGNHLDGFWFHAQTVWGGRYDRNYHVGGDETDVPLAAPRPRGWGTMLGLGSSFDYRLRDLPRVHDRIASVGLGGPTFEFSARRSVLVRLSLSAQYAFAIVGSMAYRTRIRAGARPDHQDAAARQRVLLRARRGLRGHVERRSRPDRLHRRCPRGLVLVDQRGRSRSIDHSERPAVAGFAPLPDRRRCGRGPSSAPSASGARCRSTYMSAPASGPSSTSEPARFMATPAFGSRPPPIALRPSPVAHRPSPDRPDRSNRTRSALRPSRAPPFHRALLAGRGLFPARRLPFEIEMQPTRRKKHVSGRAPDRTRGAFRARARVARLMGVWAKREARAAGGEGAKREARAPSPSPQNSKPTRPVAFQVCIEVSFTDCPCISWSSNVAR